MEDHFIPASSQTSPAMENHFCMEHLAKQESENPEDLPIAVFYLLNTKAGSPGHVLVNCRIVFGSCTDAFNKCIIVFGQLTLYAR
jgi:hypothetical protein